MTVSVSRFERTQQFLRPARSMALLTAASRVLGMVSEILMARGFGAGVVRDAFQLAFQLPNTFRRIFGEGALSASMIPVLSEVRVREGKEGVAHAAGAVLGWLSAVLAALVAVGWGVIAGFGLWGASRGDAAHAAQVWLVANLHLLLLPYLFLICLTAAQAGVLNVLDSFALPALSPILYNIVEIAGIGTAIWAWDLSHRPGDGATASAIYLVAAFVLVGGGVQLASQWLGLHSLGARVRLRWNLSDPRLRKILSGMVPIAIGLAPVQLGILMDSWFAKWFIRADGPNSHLGYANMLFQLPLSIVGISVATAAFPLFSRLAALGERRELGHAAASALRQGFFLLFPAMVGLICLNQAIVWLVYGGGKFDGTAAYWTGQVLVGYAAGLPASGALQIMTRLYYATGDRITPMRIGGLLVALNAALSFWLLHVYREAGIALATSISSWISAGVMAVHLARRFPEMLEPELIRSLARSVLAGLALAAFAFWISPRLGLHGGMAWRGLALGAVAAGVAVYGAAAFLLRSPELGEILHSLKRRAPPAEGV